MSLAAVIAWPEEFSDALPLALWDSAAIAAATGGTASAPFQASGVEIDSRDVQPGDLFFALIGESMDGHRFVEMAMAKGAVAAVVDRPIAAPHVLVPDTFVALQQLAKAARDRTAARIIGVTGSVGKTGVKEAIFAALDRASHGQAHRSVKSYNNHVGVPLSLARMAARSEFGVFEMGMNHAGEISGLTQQVRPHVAVITTIAPAHIENLGSEEAIADAKAEIFAGLELGGTAIIPADSPHFKRLRDAALRLGAQVVSFGSADHADVRLLDSVAAPGGGSLVTADLGDRKLCYTVAAPGLHWVSNSLAVMAAVRAVGGDLGAAGLALAEMASMRATLAQLGATPATRRIVVLGAMKELGEHGPAFHAALLQPIADAHVDFAVLVGDEMTALADELGKSGVPTLGNSTPFAHCRDAAEALNALARFGLAGGDAVLVKGSNSVGLGAVVAALTSKDG